MNLKDRLENIKQSNVISIKEDNFFDNAVNIAEIFLDDISVQRIIFDIIKKEKNIIFVANKSVDKMLIAQYFQHLFKDLKTNVTSNVEDNLVDVANSINIIPNPNIAQIIKIFEYVIYGYRPFVFGLDLASYDKIIEKIRTLIAINFNSLSRENVETLISSSDAVFVSVKQNEDGLFYISQIDELVEESSTLYLKNIFKILLEQDNSIVELNDAAETSIVINEDDSFDEKDACILPFEDNIVDETETIENQCIPEIVQQVDKNIETEIDTKKVQDQEEKLEENIPVKVNKYKILKEKIKNKKNNV